MISIDVSDVTRSVTRIKKRVLRAPSWSWVIIPLLLANVNFTQGLKTAGDRVSAVSGFSSPSATTLGMSVDDNTVAFANTQTACNSGGASPHFQGNPLDGAGVGVGGAAATPYVVSHTMTLTTAQFNTFVVKRIALHSTNAPTDASATLMFGIDGFSLTKASSFSLVITFKLSYS